MCETGPEWGIRYRKEEKNLGKKHFYFLPKILLFLSRRKKTLEDNFTLFKLYFLNINFFLPVLKSVTQERK